MTYGICNGTAAGAYRCPTKAEALRLAEAYADPDCRVFEHVVDELCQSPTGAARCVRA